MQVVADLRTVDRGERPLGVAFGSVGPVRPPCAHVGRGRSVAGGLGRPWGEVRAAWSPTLQTRAAHRNAPGSFTSS